MAMMVPAELQLALGGWRRRQRPAGWLALAFAAVCLLVTAAGLLLSASRGAWLGLAVALLLWVTWVGAGKVTALQHNRTERLLVPVFALLVALIAFHPIILTFIRGFLGEGINRLELMRLSTLLVRDTRLPASAWGPTRWSSRLTCS